MFKELNWPYPRKYFLVNDPSKQFFIQSKIVVGENLEKGFVSSRGLQLRSRLKRKEDGIC